MILVDTGKNGGAVSMDDWGRFKSFFKFEMSDEVFLNLVEFQDWLLEQNDNEVVIERIPTIPNQSVVSTATQFFHVGCIYAAVYLSLEAVGLDLIDIYPKTWFASITRLHMRLPAASRDITGKPKRISEAVARYYFPDICKEYTKRTRTDDALCDTLCMFLHMNIDNYLED